MPADLSIVIADATRMSEVSKGLQLPGRALLFTADNLGSALESIRTQQPKLVAVDVVFAQTPSGTAFVDRVEKLAISGADIRLVAHLEGRWTTMHRAVRSAVIDTQKVGLSTRRAPRFLVRDPLKAVVEGGTASLVDISILGAQVVSQPVLRPNQKIKLALPDTSDVLRLTAQVAWSMYQKPKPEMDAYYRAGIEFTDAAQQMLEDYRRRHCAENPIPYRGR
jgi:hypothetical protein